MSTLALSRLPLSRLPLSRLPLSRNPCLFGILVSDARIELLLDSPFSCPGTISPMLSLRQRHDLRRKEGSLRICIAKASQNFHYTASMIEWLVEHLQASETRSNDMRKTGLMNPAWALKHVHHPRT
ncbi:MAG: hypothetical protein Q9202_006907 [Teloschistes flavicans]